MIRRAQWVAAIAAYVVYIAVVLAPIWSGRIEPKWDGREFNYPAFAYAAAALRGGHLPLWDPYTACGQPFISDPAYLWYQPGAVLASLLRASHLDAYLLFWAGIWAWAGFGAFVLAAVLGAGPGGCVASAIMYSLSGFFVGHGQHVPYLVTAAWFPWALAFAHRAVARVSWADALLMAAALGLSALGGYAGLVIFEGIAITLWLVLAFLVPAAAPASEHPLPWRGRLTWMAKVLVTAAGLLFVIWSPSLWAFFVEAADFTDRTRPLADELVLRVNSFPVLAWTTFLFPRLSIDLCHAHPDACFGTDIDISMVNAYAGALAVPLAAVYVAYGRRRAAWIAAFIVVWLWVAAGSAGGLRTVFHVLIPATRFMRHNGMLRALSLAPLAAAAGVGVTLAASVARARASLILTAAFVVTALAAAWAGLVFEAGPFHVLRWALPALLVLGAAALITWVIRGSGRTVTLALVALVGVDLAWHVQSNQFTIGDPLNDAAESPLRRIEALDTAVDPMAPRGLWDSKLALVNRIPVVKGYVALASRAFAPLVEGPFQSVLASQRYWLSPSAWPAPLREAGVAVLANFRAGTPAPLFVGRRDDALPGEPVVPGSFGSVEVVSYAPERIEIIAYVPPGEGAILASTERFAPSWHVRVDGVERPVAVVDYFFRGVRLSVGEHRVIFDYQPRPFVPLLTLSYATILMLIGGAALAEHRARSRSGRGREPRAAPHAVYPS